MNVDTVNFLKIAGVRSPTALKMMKILPCVQEVSDATIDDIVNDHLVHNNNAHEKPKSLDGVEEKPHGHHHVRLYNLSLIVEQTQLRRCMY